MVIKNIKNVPFLCPQLYEYIFLRHENVFDTANCYFILLANLSLLITCFRRDYTTYISNAEESYMYKISI